MDWIIGMQKAIDYIEEHITEEIDYEMVAQQSFSSSFHFQRVFSILCGYTLGEYIRCRRLSLAGAELALGKIKVIDAAVKYGYDSPDSFGRAFQKFHGLTPSDARRKGSSLQSFSPLVLKIVWEGGSRMHYRVEDKPELILTGYKRRFQGVPGDREDQECDFYVHTRAQQYLLNGMSDHPETQHNVVMNIDDEGYDFYIAQELPRHTRERMGEDCVLGEPYASLFENIRVPAHTYAIFETERCRYPTVVFPELRRRIVSEWLPGSGYQFADAPEIVVTHWFGRLGCQERYRELWIPVEQKG